MKNLRLSLAVIFFAIAATSCQKNLDSQVDPNESSNGNGSTNPLSFTESGWENPPEWSTVEQPTYSVFYSNLKAPISSDDAENGLVRVFKVADPSNPALSQSLPFEEKVNGEQVYWYYQITAGNLMLSMDAYNTKTNPVDKSQFKYVVIGKDALATLEAKDISRAALMDMSYDELLKINKQ